jgi:hypothetical protein
LVNVLNDLSRLEVDSMMIQEGEALAILSGSKNNSINNIK